MDPQIVIDALTRIVTDIVAYLPSLANGLLVLLVGYLVARVVRWLLWVVLRRIGIDPLAERSGVVTGLQRLGIRLIPSMLMAQIVFALLLLTFLITATRLMRLEAVAVLLERLLTFLPNIVAALIVFLVGTAVARLVGLFVAGSAASVGLSYARQLGRLVEYLVNLFVVVLALGVLGVNIGLLVTAITILIAAFGLALGLALGLGARPIAYQILAGYYVRQRLRPGQAIHLAQVRGEVSGTGSINTVVTTTVGPIIVPNSVLIESMVYVPPRAGTGASAADSAANV